MNRRSLLSGAATLGLGGTLAGCLGGGLFELTVSNGSRQFQVVALRVVDVDADGEGVVHSGTYELQGLFEDGSAVDVALPLESGRTYAVSVVPGDDRTETFTYEQDGPDEARLMVYRGYVDLELGR